MLRSALLAYDRFRYEKARSFCFADSKRRLAGRTKKEFLPISVYMAQYGRVSTSKESEK
jgi:hypothetical protein